MVNLWDFALNKLSSSSLNKLFSHRGTMKNIIIIAILLMLASCQKCEEEPTQSPLSPLITLTLDSNKMVLLPWKVDSMPNGRIDCYYKDVEDEITLLCVFKNRELYIEPNGFYKGRSFVILHKVSPIRLELCGDDDDVITYDDINLSFKW